LFATALAHACTDGWLRAGQGSPRRQRGRERRCQRSRRRRGIGPPPLARGRGVRLYHRRWSGAAAVIDTRRSRAQRRARSVLETSLPTEPVTTPNASPVETARPRPSRRGANRWSVAARCLLGLVVVLAACLGWDSFDAWQVRLQDTGLRLDASARRFEHYWALHDAAVEAALALRWELSSAAGVPAQRDPASAAGRFESTSAALLADLDRPGEPLPTQGAAYAEAVHRLSATLNGLGVVVSAHGADAGAVTADPADRSMASAQATPAAFPARASSDAGTGDGRLALARSQTQQMLDALALVAREARERQSMPAAFLDELAAARRQVLGAFSLVVALLALALGFTAQWVFVARRERAMHARAEQLAAVAEAEGSRAEAVARDNARFLGMLSHELLTPLQSIWSTIDVIESRGRVEAHDPAFARLRESTRSLRGRISDLVDFAKISSGRLETRIRGFQLDKLVDTALRDVEEALAARNLDVHWEAGPELSQRLYADPARLRQIVDNLLSNAIKYTERGGITINAELEQDVSLLRLEIADTGVGIPPDEVARLFEPFYRAPSTAAMAEGSGLGLAVVRSLVDLMGGSIHVDSRVGQGTSVVVELPVAKGKDGAVDAPQRIDLRLPVLVVDDSRDARRAISDVIRALGIDVYEAESGHAGLAEAARRTYQAIVLDMQMPDLSGYEVALALRKPDSRQRDSFLILVSAYNDLDDASTEGVFDARLDKPVSRRDLMSALARAAQRLG